MTSIAQIRQQYPQYANLSDQQLADALYTKFYSSMPRDQFNAKIGFAPSVAGAPGAPTAQAPNAGAPSGTPPAQASAPQSSGNPVLDTLGTMGQQALGIGQNLMNIPGALAGQVQQIASDPSSIPDRFNAFGSGVFNNMPVVGPILGPAMDQAKSWAQGLIGNPISAQDVGTREAANRAKYPTEATEGGVVGGTAPFAIGGAIPMGAKLLGLEGPLLSRAALGATSQFGIDTADNVMHGQPLPQAATNSILPSVLGGATSTVLGGRVSGNPAVRDAAGTLSDAGVNLTNAQKMGNTLMQKVESQGFGAGKVAANQTDAITQAALAPAGIDATRATPDVMAKAYSDFGDRFDTLGGSTDVPYDKTLTTRLQSVVDDYADNAFQPAPIIAKMKASIDNIAANNGGVLSGDAYQNIRSQIAKKLKTTTNPDTRNALDLMQDALDDGVARNMGPDELAQWQALRGQYKNFVVARNALPAGDADAAAGIITPQNLANSVQKTEGQLGWTIGRGDSNDLAHAAMVTPPMKPAGVGSQLVHGMVGAGLGAGAGALGLHLGMPELGTVALGALVPKLLGTSLLAGGKIASPMNAALAQALLTSGSQP